MYLFSKTDRIPVVIDEVTFWIAPISNEQKADIASIVGFDGGEKSIDREKMYRACLKYSVKRVDGVLLPAGGKFQVKLDKKGNLTEKSVDDLMMLSCSAKLASASVILMNEIKDVDLDGVTVDIKGTIPEKKLESLSL